MGVEPDTDKEDIYCVVLGDVKERHWRMVFKENNGGVDRMKSLLHAKKWDILNS